MCLNSQKYWVQGCVPSLSYCQNQNLKDPFFLGEDFVLSKLLPLMKFSSLKSEDLILLVCSLCGKFSYNKMFSCCLNSASFTSLLISVVTAKQYHLFNLRKSCQTLKNICTRHISAHVHMCLK